MSKKNVLRSFRINAQLWEKFTEYCAKNEITATAAITNFIESTVAETPSNNDTTDCNDSGIDTIYTRYIKDIEIRLSLIESKICNDGRIDDDIENETQPIENETQPIENETQPIENETSDRNYAAAIAIAKEKIIKGETLETIEKFLSENDYQGKQGKPIKWATRLSKIPAIKALKEKL